LVAKHAVVNKGCSAVSWVIRGAASGGLPFASWKVGSAGASAHLPCASWMEKCAAAKAHLPCASAWTESYAVANADLLESSCKSFLDEGADQLQKQELHPHLQLLEAHVRLGETFSLREGQGFDGHMPNRRPWEYKQKASEVAKSFRQACPCSGPPLQLWLLQLPCPRPLKSCVVPPLQHLSEAPILPQPPLLERAICPSLAARP